MNKIAVITTTRAEYGLLEPVIKELREKESAEFQVQLIVTGTHLSDEYGNTIGDIKANGSRIDHVIRIPVASANEEDISSNQAGALVKFTRLFCQERYKAVIILGDRYETLAIAIAAGNTKTPLFHMCGGDTTEGAIDEWIRHSITKMSYLHFVTNEESLRRVIQLGEAPERVFNYGSTSIDNILSIADMSKEEVLRSVGLVDCKYALCTYHPVTMEKGSVDEQINALLDAIIQFPELQFIFTKSNADQGGARINELLDTASEKITNLNVYTSLGARKYLSLMKYAEFVLGNSSSGIIEAPAFQIPTINIGDRQKGRLQTSSVINCSEKTEDIVKSISLALQDDFKTICKETEHVYGDGTAAKSIAKKIMETLNEGTIDLKKQFYDIK